MDTKGRLIHIDFGFVFGIAPGKKFSMETAPFKLTAEKVDVSTMFISLFANYAILCYTRTTIWYKILIC